MVRRRLGGALLFLGVFLFGFRAISDPHVTEPLVRRVISSFDKFVRSRFRRTRVHRDQSEVLLTAAHPVIGGPSVQPLLAVVCALLMLRGLVRHSHTRRYDLMGCDALPKQEANNANGGTNSGHTTQPHP